LIELRKMFTLVVKESLLRTERERDGSRVLARSK
jgi:hypothetical protein